MKSFLSSNFLMMARTSSSLYCRYESVCDWKLYHIIVAMLFIFIPFNLSNLQYMWKRLLCRHTVRECGWYIDINIELKDVIKICCMKHSWYENENLLEKFYWKVYFQSVHNAVMEHSALNIEDRKHSTMNAEKYFFFRSFSPFFQSIL